MADSADIYIDRLNIYNGTQENPFAGSNKEAQLEQIITQKWLAVFPNGNEGWAEFRRTGFPRIFPIVEPSQDPSIDKNVQIRRMVFPKLEYANNAGAVNAAVRLLGGSDNGGTKLWWDKKN